jgi:hypothetical protein
MNWDDNNLGRYWWMPHAMDFGLSLILSLLFSL